MMQDGDQDGNMQQQMDDGQQQYIDPNQQQMMPPGNYTQEELEVSQNSACYLTHITDALVNPSSAATTAIVNDGTR